MHHAPRKIERALAQHPVGQTAPQRAAAIVEVEAGDAAGRIVEGIRQRREVAEALGYGVQRR